jgi:hypothetical protein
MLVPAEMFQLQRLCRLAGSIACVDVGFGRNNPRGRVS